MWSGTSQVGNSTTFPNGKIGISSFGTRSGYLTPPRLAATFARSVPPAIQKLDRATRKRLVERLNRDATQLARHFGLRFRHIEAERAGVKSRYGACFEDGTIKIRLVHATTGAPLRYSSLVDTLCHELAHLKYWHHGPGFQAYYKRILEKARREGIYEPTRRPKTPRTPHAAPLRAACQRTAGSVSAARAVAPVGPEQLLLFGAAE